MQKKFEIYRTQIKGGCQSGRKVVSRNSMSDLPLVHVQKQNQKTDNQKIITVTIKAVLVGIFSQLHH